MLSIIASTLATEPNSRFVLVYRKRTSQSVMFTEEIADLKHRYLTRLEIFHVLSREEHQAPRLSGRIDKAKLDILLELNPPPIPSMTGSCVAPPV